MITWWRHRQALKHARETVHGARKLVRMHRDIISPADYEAIVAATDKLAAAVRQKTVSSLDDLADQLHERVEKVFPRDSTSSLRENVEVFLVAAIVAMAIRTFFLQPFKIPTGSMQPTLNGIIEDVQYDRDRPLWGRLFDLVFYGKHPVTPGASLPVSVLDTVMWTVLGQWPAGARCLASGDHIFVDRFTYHFRHPERGEVVVFETGFMRDRGFDPRGNFYIKRLVAKGGDHVEIAAPYLKIDDKVMDARPAFQRLYSMQNGYHGYLLPEHYSFPNPPQFLHAQKPKNVVPSNEYLVLGDNTRSSLDGRYWGGVPHNAMVGRGVFVYWPFLHFGRID